MFFKRTFSWVMVLALVGVQACYGIVNTTVDQRERVARERKVLAAKVAAGTTLVALAGGLALYKCSDPFRATVDNLIARAKETQHAYASVVTQKVSQGWTSLSAGLQSLWSRAKQAWSGTQSTPSIVGNNLDYKYLNTPSSGFTLAPTASTFYAPEPSESFTGDIRVK